MKVAIKKVYAADRNKDGEIYEGKYGPFWRVGIKTQEHGDQWINGFTKSKPEWNEGDEVELEIFEKEYNGEMQLNFKLPKKTVSREEIQSILDRLTTLELQVSNLLQNKSMPVPEEDEEMPF